MKNHLREIAARYPRLFENGVAPQWSYVFPGWSDLVEQLCADLDAALPPGQGLRVVQVKEKFGGLRFYYHVDAAGDLANALTKIKAEAENRSFKMCEGCGVASAVRLHGGWYTTLCPACLAVVRAERAAERAREQD